MIIDDDSVVELMGQLQLLLGKIKVGSNQQLDRRSAKGILEGKGAFFNPPKELEEIKFFLKVLIKVALKLLH